MILKFTGGVRFNERTDLGFENFQNVPCTAVCIPASDDAEITATVGEAVKRGTLLGTSFDTPVYSSIPGIFKGILVVEEKRYFAVMNSGEEGEEPPMEPETRNIMELGLEDIVAAAKKFAIIDTRSGVPLWKLLEKCGGCRRVVIDCTEPDSLGATNFRLGIDNAKSAVMGGKILLRASGALKCVFAAEHNRSALFEALEEYATDEKLFAMAPMDDKYPYGDCALVDGIYVRYLKVGQSPLDVGILIVSLEAAIALYNAMVSGLPHLDRYLTFCGESLPKKGNFKIPRGATLFDLLSFCGAAPQDYLLVENSRLNGKTMGGIIADTTRAIISVLPQKPSLSECVYCGECVKACPVKLYPFEINESKKRFPKNICIQCGACQYICPAGIPLMDMIKEADIVKTVEVVKEPETVKEPEVSETTNENAEKEDSQ